MSLPSLSEMLDIAGKHATMVIIGAQSQMIPLFDLRDARGDSYLVAEQFVGATPADVVDRKDAVADFVREMIVRHKIIQYSFMSEAWMIKRKDWKGGVSAPPSEADDRIECVIAIATDGKDYLSRRWLIKREGETCVDLVLDSDGDTTQRPWGRFDNLLGGETMQ